MGRKENEKVGIFNCHGMGGNQVSSPFLSASYLRGQEGHIIVKTITLDHGLQLNYNKDLT